jgi:hypothetical protein
LAAHIDGFELKYIARMRMAERRLNGTLIDRVPVAWADSWRQVSVPRPLGEAAPASKKPRKLPPPDVFVTIRCDDAVERRTRLGEEAPFVIALALSRRGDDQGPEKFVEFRGVFEVAATGIELPPDSFEARVIRRARPVETI